MVITPLSAWRHPVSREQCPGCGADTLLPVIYGMPLPGDFDNPDAIFAGCIVPAVMLDDPVECEREDCSWSGGLLDGQRVGSLMFSLADHLYMASLDEGGDMVPVEDLERMTVEITLGWQWGDPRTRVPDTPEHREKWERLAQQVADITARGNIVEIPNEWPDLDDYEPGTI